MRSAAVAVVVVVLGCGGPRASPGAAIEHAAAPAISEIPDPVPAENAGAWWTKEHPCPDGARLREQPGEYTETRCDPYQADDDVDQGQIFQCHDVYFRFISE